MSAPLHTNPASTRALALSFKRQGMMTTYAALLRVANMMEEYNADVR